MIAYSNSAAGAAAPLSRMCQSTISSLRASMIRAARRITSARSLGSRAAQSRWASFAAA